MELSLLLSASFRLLRLQGNLAVGLSLLVCFLGIGVCSDAASAATIEWARRPDGSRIVGVKIEGEIVPGDAAKLLNFYKEYGAFISPIYLRSKGGDVEEAMKMGTLVRQLRLKTEAPKWQNGQPPFSAVPANSKDNMICASACFLIYVAGAERQGNYVALHRPYLTRPAARQLSDVEVEARQKQVMAKVREYLRTMEVEQFWIDKMMSTNSQNAYIPTLSEFIERHLDRIAPSIEEIVLSKCTDSTADVEKKMKAVRGRSLSDDQLTELYSGTTEFLRCKATVLEDLQRAAFNRQYEPTVKAKCGSLSPTPDDEAILKKLRGRDMTQWTTEERKLADQWSEKSSAFSKCKSAAVLDHALKTTANYRKTYENAEKPPAALPSPDKPLDVTGLSTDDMVKRGEDSSKQKNYAEAMRWYKSAADLGNAPAMLRISRLSDDEVEAMGWLRKAADLGEAEAMHSLGYAYANGKGVTKDYDEALRWYRRGADLGNARATFHVGWAYARGEGVAQDYVEAMRWYKKAADLNDTLAMYSIGMLYEYGNGVEKDDAQARVWLRKAAALDDWASNRWLVDHPSP